MIRELEKRSRERLQQAFESLRLPDSSDYIGIAETEYKKELARNIQKSGSKVANPSTDQHIAGKLKIVGYSPEEIEYVIEHYSPMAVKPNLGQSQAYAKSIVQKARLPGHVEAKREGRKRCLSSWGLDTKVEPIVGFFPEVLNEDNELFPIDILVDTKLSHEKIATACASIFSIHLAEIVVMEDISDSEVSVDEKILLICEAAPIRGDFKVFLSLYSQDFTLEDRAENIGDELIIAKIFCKLLNVKALIKEDSVAEEDYEEDAYLMIDGEDTRRVYVDLDQIDDDVYLLTNELG